MILLMLLLAGEPWEGLDAKRFELVSLKGCESPTSILWVDKQLYVTADYLAPRPGLYRLTRRGRNYRAGLVAHLPMQQIDGLHPGPGGSLDLVSGRFFTGKSEDWVDQIITIDPVYYQQAGTIFTGTKNRCRLERPGCGLVGIHRLPDGRILAMSGRGPARLHLLQEQGDRWQTVWTTTLRTRKGNAIVSELRVIGTKLVILVKNKWQLAAIELEQALGYNEGGLPLEPVFDFSNLEDQFRLGSQSFYFDGIAEGFDFDSEGNLLVLLNNRGYPFKQTPDNKKDDQPLILIFPRAVPTP